MHLHAELLRLAEMRIRKGGFVMQKTKSVEQQFKAISKRILDRIAKDPAFHKQMLDDPEGALVAAGFEAEIESLDWPTSGAVIDDCRTTCGYRSCKLTCVTTCHLSCRNPSI